MASFRLKPYTLLLLLLSAPGAQAADSCAAVPAAFAPTCKELQGDLDTFNATLDSQWNGAKSPVAFAAELLAANDNRGLQVILSPETMDGVLRDLEGMARIGVQAVTIAVGFPILDQRFYEFNNDPQDYPRVVNFYRGVMAELRKRGLKVIIETSVMFPREAQDLPLGNYYATLSPADLIAGRARVAQTIAQQLQPDWMNLGSEPDTQSALLRLRAKYTPEQYAAAMATIVNQLRKAGIHDKPLIGAGIGTWAPNAGEFVRALAATNLDYIDFHIYSVNQGYLAAAPALIDLAHKSGKGAAISEAWLKKVSNSQLSGGGQYATIRALSDPMTTAQNNYSFWAPLDSQFVTELVKLAHWKKLYYLSPFASQCFFAYVDYAQAGSMPTPQLRRQGVAVASAALRAGTLSPTGQAYAAAIKGTSPPPNPKR